MKSVLITGASSGIGQECALHLDRLGWRVFAGVRKEESGAALRAKASGWLTPVLLDVTDPVSIEDAARKVSETLDGAGLDGLVNNAGVAVAGPLEFLPIKELRNQLEINVIGQIAVTQAFLPLLRTAKGRIVNIGSISGRAANPLVGAYSASKHAIEALTDSLRMELLPWGIEVAVIEPGSIKTPIWDKSLAAGDAMLDQLPPQADQYYGRVVGAMKKYARYAAKKGTPAVRVAQAVEHALTAPRPKTRYIIGRDAWLRYALQKLPDRTRDRLITGQLNRLG